MAGYNRFKRQFRNDNFQTAEFPRDTTELNILSAPLKSFLIYRILRGGDNSSIAQPLKDFVGNTEFQGRKEHYEIMGLYGAFFELSDDDLDQLTEHFNATRAKTPEFPEKFLQFILDLHDHSQLDLTPEADKQLSLIVDKSVKDELSDYFKVIDVIHTKGYTNEIVHEAVRIFYHRFEGLSLINECVRKTIFNYFARYIKNLEVGEYTSLFEISKLFPVYIDIFVNQKFNQDIKELCMRYIRKLLKHYTDKRAKDYQDIKKFVSTTFQDLNFLKEKEVVELFKTRRKRKTAA